MKFVRLVNSARVHCSLLKIQNMRLGKKKKRKETQTWIHKYGSKRILNSDNHEEG